jgi:YHS domain-containing protein
MKLFALFLAPIVLVLIALSPAACGGEQAAVPPTASPSATSAVVPNGEAKVGDKTRCPVSGDEFTVTDKSPHAEYNGKTYYFCCPDCSGKFLSDPPKYLAKPKT